MNWYESIQTKIGKDIARDVFSDYTTQEIISLKHYSNRRKYAKGKKKKVEIIKNGVKIQAKEKKELWVEPTVNRYFKIWSEADLIERSKPIRFKDKLGRPQKVYWKRISLNVIFKYCEEIKNINFSLDEKIYFAKLFHSKEIREKIREEYPQEDIVQAILKFYTKNFILKYSFYLSELRNNPSSFREERKEARKLNDKNNPMRKDYLFLMRYLKKTYNAKRKSYLIDPLTVRTYRYSNKIKDTLFKEYSKEFEKTPEMIIIFDRKILKALGIYPNIDIK